MVGQIFSFSHLFLSHRSFYQVYKLACAAHIQKTSIWLNRGFWGTLFGPFWPFCGDSIYLSYNDLAIAVCRSNANDNVLQQPRLSYLSMQCMRWTVAYTSKVHAYICNSPPWKCVQPFIAYYRGIEYWHKTNSTQRLWEEEHQNRPHPRAREPNQMPCRDLLVCGCIAVLSFLCLDYCGHWL